VAERCDISLKTLYEAARMERSNTRLHTTTAVREKSRTYKTGKRRRGGAADR